MAIPYSKSKIEGNIFTNISDKKKYLGNLDYWITKEGDVIKISNLRKTHIKNILQLMRTKTWRIEYKPVLEHELLIREMKKTKAGRLLYGITKES